MGKLKKVTVDEIYYYGTGCGNATNAKMIAKVLKHLFTEAKVKVSTDIAAAAHATCGNKKGITCILGTGSNVCYFDGKKIVKSRPGLGYALGDEGSGAYLGKKVLQYYFYDVFYTDIKNEFEKAYPFDKSEILDNIYKKPLANRYLASFSKFLSAHRGDVMIENIIEDGLNDFFFLHLSRMKEARNLPVHFVGGVSFAFKDVLLNLCANYNFTSGLIIEKPMKRLVKFHTQQ